jgi:histidine triad (HIT) family protein
LKSNCLTKKGCGSLTEHCIFCQIVRNEKPANIIYEDGRTIAFLDIRPISEGHTLVVPKKHYRDIHEIPDKEAAFLFKVAKKVATAVEKGVNADGISIFQNNGRAAGQVIFHIHVHIVPRFEEKRMSYRRNANSEELDNVAEKIRQYL